VRGRLVPSAIYPAGVTDVRARTVTIRNGLQLRIAESGPASGSPVLLIHGWGACIYTYRYLLPVLGGAGCRVIAFDLRGHGLSDKPGGEASYTATALREDVLALLDALGVARVDLIGHSLGGAVALQVALSTPERVGRMVLAAPVGLGKVRLRDIGHALTPRITDRFARFLTPRWLTSFLLHGAYGDPTKVPNEAVDEYWAPSQFPGYYRALRALLAVFAWEPLSPAELRRIIHPILVILGTADRLIPDASRGAAWLAKATVLSLKSAGHLGIEECATESNEAVLRFLAGDHV
jgi:pimeloyl-ACP methyl ester carboxylesterase